MNNNLKLKDRREELGLTQDEVARQLGIDRSTYTKIENGDRGTTIRMTLAIIKILKLDIRNVEEITKYFKY